MTGINFLRVQLDALDGALGAANSGEDERGAYVRFVAEVRAVVAPRALQANGFPPGPALPAPNADFTQPISEDARQRRELNLRFNPTQVEAPVLPLEPVDAKAAKAAP